MVENSKLAFVGLKANTAALGGLGAKVATIGPYTNRFSSNIIEGRVDA